MVMNLQTSFTLPDEIVSGLEAGQLIRRGGVIQRSSGEIAAWLREIDPQPVPPRLLGQSAGGGAIAKRLGFTGNCAGILNLGATVSFGSHLNRRLNRTEESINTLQWSVDWCFRNLLGRFVEVQNFLDAGLQAKLRSAAQQAWGAQRLDPGNPNRAIRLEHALASASEATEHLLILAEQNSEKPWTAKVDYHRQALMLVRRAIGGSCLQALILAELGQVWEAAAFLRTANDRARQAYRHHPRLNEWGLSKEPWNEMLLRLFEQRKFKRGQTDRGFFLFHDLEPEAAWEIAFRYTQIFHSPDTHPFTIFDEAGQRQLVECVKLLEIQEGNAQDFDRQLGMIQELEFCGRSGLSWQDYRTALTVEDAPVDKRLAVLWAR